MWLKMPKSLENLEIVENIQFMIKYCDTFLDYCHNENLSIDGNIAGEIVDSITEIEEYLEDPTNVLEQEDLQTIYDYLSSIYDGLQNLNDIKLFNNVHIVYSLILSQTKERLDSNRDNYEWYKVKSDWIYQKSL